MDQKKIVYIVLTLAAGLS